MKRIIFLTCLLFVAFNVKAQEINKAKLDSLLSMVEEYQKGMGSLSIFRNGKEIYQKSIGYSDTEHKIEAGKNTKYRIGSVSKMFTATIIMQLVEKGKLTTESKLSEFFPDLPHADKITVLHLLKHQSGVFDLTNSPTFDRWKLNPKTKDEVLGLIKTNETVFNPGERTQYSNTNYVLLTYIAEKIEDEDFSKILKRRITKPLRLKNTYLGSAINPKDKEAFSYAKMGNWHKGEETHFSIPQGAGLIVSTPTDLNTFIWALSNGELVNKTSLERMQEMEGGYGIGLNPINIDGEKMIGHTGRIDNFSSVLCLDPVRNISFAYTSNGVDMPAIDLLKGIFSISFGKEYKLPSFSAPYVNKPEDLKPLEGVYGNQTFPLKVKIYTANGVLMADGVGQKPIYLEAIEKNKFKFERANLTLEFIPAENKMLFTRGDRTEALEKDI
ncbi:serine hydrolase domain-containing protein [Pontibacter harenae]|uniref:serine hydrolase domain-containing protein n=1 Tax=Pontibacter harenae TaxID=2894083 RepID=UPI001E4A1B60|nr:serine hydrolase domain-containing protein [Pontibacter harenae]MCC9168007.1 beta-lactamase family protein [Pontibacter harenae]